ncbi:MAG: hypothetical protein HZB39_11985 [Planctomycetes bacterium]|nr:hypothetical protein [Planctomycetota bacterium]
MTDVRSLVLLAALAVPTFAQSTWIVDAAGGGHFTDLPAAVTAAAPGDTLIVRAGGYTAPTITRGLIVRGSPSVRVTSGRLAIRGLPASEFCSIFSMAMELGFDVESCPGAVHVDSCGISGPGRHVQFGSSGYLFGSALIFDSRQVILRNCAVWTTSGFAAALDAYSSSMLLVRCSISGRPPSGGSWNSSSTPGTPGLFASDSLVSLEGCTIQGGGDGFYNLGHWGTIPLPGPAVFGGRHNEFRIVGSTPVSVTFLGASQSPLVTTTGGRILYDTRTGFGGYCSSYVANCTSTTFDFASITQYQTSLDLAITATTGATSQFLLSSLPSAPVDLPGLGLSWLDPATLAPVGGPQIHQAARRTLSLPILAPLPAGLPITVQAAVFRAGAITLSEPSTLILR